MGGERSLENGDLRACHRNPPVWSGRAEPLSPTARTPRPRRRKSSHACSSLARRARIEGKTLSDIKTFRCKMSPQTSLPEFEKWDSYQKFAKRVRRERRFATDPDSGAFIATVLATIHEREMALSKGQILYRAQLGIDVQGEGGDSFVTGFPAHRMKPIPEKATEGRANPAGIAFLYLASTVETAISEVRPWIGSDVSVAQARILRDMRIVNLTQGHGKFGFLDLTMGQVAGTEPIDAETKKRIVWTEIDSAFSRPVTRTEDAVDYVPTQILAEAFRQHGFDGVVYCSNFGDPGYNLALFDPDSVEIINCAPYEIENIRVEFREMGNRWFKRE